MEALKSLDVENTGYSSKLQRFLKKLTSEKPALRYQTARQALSELNNLEKITEEDLDKSLTTVTRGKNLQRLLDRLQEKDDWFDYNVSAQIRGTYDDDKLIAHLERTYLQPEFVIEDSNEVERYAWQNERVRKKGNSYKHKVLVEKGTKGKIKKTRKQGTKVKVDFSRWSEVEGFIKEKKGEFG